MESMKKTAINIHDYTEHRWGHGISIWITGDKGLTANALGHGRGLKINDLMLLSDKDNNITALSCSKSGLLFKSIRYVEYRCKICL